MSQVSPMCLGQRAYALIRNSGGHSLSLSSTPKLMLLASCCDMKWCCIIGTAWRTVLSNYLEITKYFCLATCQPSWTKRCPKPLSHLYSWRLNGILNIRWFPLYPSGWVKNKASFFFFFFDKNMASTGNQDFELIWWKLVKSQRWNREYTGWKRKWSISRKLETVWYFYSNEEKVFLEQKYWRNNKKRQKKKKMP